VEPEKKRSERSGLVTPNVRTQLGVDTSTPFTVTSSTPSTVATDSSSTNNVGLPHGVEPQPTEPFTPIISGSSSTSIICPQLRTGTLNLEPFSPIAPTLPSDIKAMLKLFHSKPRRPCIQQLYSHFHWDERIAPTYDALVAALPDSSDATIQTVTLAIDRCWAAEPEEFKAALKEKMDKLFAEQMHNWDSLANATDGIAIGPEERAR
jgi:hypothetical protein